MTSELREAKAKFQAGAIDEADRLARDALSSAKAASDPEGVGRATLLRGDIAYERLRYREACDHLRRAADTLDRALSPAATPARQARASLALSLDALDEKQQAGQVLDAALDGLDGPRSPLDIETAGLWITIAVVMGAIAPGPRAAAILEAVIAGELHHDEGEAAMATATTATAHLHLATQLQGAGQLDQARAQQERCIELRTEAFGASNYRVAAAKFGLAQMLTTAGDIEAARAVATEAMATLQALGADREPTMSTAYAALAVVELMSGNVAVATRHLERACAMEEKTFGASHPQTATMLLMLIQVHATERNWGKVAKLCRQAVAAMQDQPSYLDPYLQCCELESTALFGMGKPRDAARRLRDVLDGLERRYARQDPERLHVPDAASRLAKLWGTLGRAELLDHKRSRAEGAFERARSYAVEAADASLVRQIERELGHVRSGAQIRLKGQS